MTIAFRHFNSDSTDKKFLYKDIRLQKKKKYFLYQTMDIILSITTGKTHQGQGAKGLLEKRKYMYNNAFMNNK